jgi:arginine:pyruvate transaminase
MNYSSLAQRIASHDNHAWKTHSAACAAKARGENVVILSVGDPTLDTPTQVTKRAIEALTSGDTHYTPSAGREALRAAIARAHRDRSGQPVDLENVIFLAGTQNALFTALLCLAGAGDEVIVLEPLYLTYPATIEVTGARVVRIPSSKVNFQPDLVALAAALNARTRAIVFATPNNPSGAIISAADLAIIAELARRYALWVVVDEVYAGLAPDGRVPSLAATLPEQVVTISSLSKTHAMPGWRAGWMVGPKSMIERADALATCMLYGLPGFVQEAALTAIETAPEAELRMRNFCSGRRDLVLTELGGVPGLRCCVPEAGMFMLIDVNESGMSGHEFVTELYRSEGVSVLDGGAFGRGTADFVRLCFATHEAPLREGCARIRQFMLRHRHRTVAN